MRIGYAQADSGEFLGDDGIGQPSLAGSTILLRNSGTEETELTNPLYQVNREILFPFPLLAIRGDLLFSKISHRPANLLLFIAKFKVHGQSSLRVMGD